LDIKEIEILRKKAMNTVLITFLTTIILTLIIFSIFSTLPSVITLSIGLQLVAVIIENSRKKFDREFKTTFVIPNLKTILSDLIYEPEKGIEESIIRETGIMNKNSRYSSNDFISGKYKNKKVIKADFLIEEKKRTYNSEYGYSKQWLPTLHGQWLIFDFKRNFKSTIIIYQNFFTNSELNYPNNQYKNIKTKDEEFDKNFIIYAQNENEALFTITPELIKKIKKIHKKIWSHDILF